MFYLVFFAISKTKDTPINSTKTDGEKSYSKVSYEKNTTDFKQQVTVVLDEGNVVDSEGGTVTLERIN
ncbi:hypothetical protein Hs20B_14690 [Lactococcus insecticola]|uniref:Uncharacterized protein n=1 Tax=Pseudolactococcus insecticola TaxID=2709158 RepID=A0A6A0B9D4_9LACT|nr:hypothetical protein Hs20B_14690 [Lactococcus insecticola]